MSRLNTVDWARNERGAYEMTGESMEALLQQHFEHGYNQAVREIWLHLREQDDSEMDRAAARISRRFADGGLP
jgi:hypothetical protein